MMIQSKAWGETQLVYEDAHISIHRITVKEGGYCSIHRHEHRHNAFLCLDGALRVDIESSPTVVDSTTLEAGQSTIAPAGMRHQFVAVTDCAAWEIYWTCELDGADIQRDTVGGSDVERMGAKTLVGHVAKNLEKKYNCLNKCFDSTTPIG